MNLAVSQGAQQCAEGFLGTPVTFAERRSATTYDDGAMGRFPGLELIHLAGAPQLWGPAFGARGARPATAESRSSRTAVKQLRLSGT